MKEYYFKFTQLTRYAPRMVTDSRPKMSKFVSGVSDSMVKEYKTTILIKEMNLARLMGQAQQIKEQKTREKKRESKKARIGSFNFTQPKSKGGNHPQFCPKSSVLALSSSSAPVPKFRMVIRIGRQALNPRVALAVPKQILFVRSIAETIRVSVEMEVMYVLDVVS